MKTITQMIFGIFQVTITLLKMSRLLASTISCRNLTVCGVSSWECKKPDPFLKSDQNRIFCQFFYFYLSEKLVVNTSLTTFVAPQRLSRPTMAILRVFLDSLMMPTEILDPNHKALHIVGCIICTATF